jgi:hypothetical protein
MSRTFVATTVVVVAGVVGASWLSARSIGKGTVSIQGEATDFDSFAGMYGGAASRPDAAA